MVGDEDVDGTVDEGWRRVADEVLSRRLELGMTQADVAAAGGPSVGTLRLLEGALKSSYRPDRIASLERVYSWEHGSIAEIRRGGKPRVKADEAPAPPALPSRAVEDIRTVDAERAYEMLQSIRRVYGEEVYAEMLARAVHARASGEERKIG